MAKTGFLITSWIVSYLLTIFKEHIRNWLEKLFGKTANYKRNKKALFSGPIGSSLTRNRARSFMELLTFLIEWTIAQPIWNWRQCQHSYPARADITLAYCNFLLKPMDSFSVYFTIIAVIDLLIYYSDEFIAYQNKIYLISQNEKLNFKRYFSVVWQLLDPFVRVRW